ncbi:3-Oxoacyl-[acyl-carrier-protein (ACP)] synthase III C terminal [Noviherbaspirillum humi]|uniref:3-Oxoacyl-[acyl-carrier-protein (ACP)] synthase III C terminal n=2 Tax=Noviherbaspirillum humi TaxID=1688639 RepID=A0A239FAQ9_9BURK|nr:3-Oxoacyl-[acyl-carrier-protein (ACP)] synthase III C terminal [Noviherbaspirillum humi]
MNGKKVMKLALQNMPAFMEELLASKGMSVETMDLIIPHQASHLGMAHMSKRIGVDPSRIVDIYSTHGNQVAASIPTALHEALASGRLQPGKRALLIGTAAGLSIGGMVMDF